MNNRVLIPIGGLGRTQLRSTSFLWWKTLGLVESLSQFNEKWDGGSWDEFRGNGLIEWINYHIDDVEFSIIGHSFGVDLAIHLSQVLGYRCKKLVLLAPVWQKKPMPMCKTLLLRPSFSLLPQAEVNSLTPQIIPLTDHNSLCHVEATLSLVKEFLQ